MYAEGAQRSVLFVINSSILSAVHRFRQFLRLMAIINYFIKLRMIMARVVTIVVNTIIREEGFTTLGLLSSNIKSK